jgi:hypothetical protein
MASRYRRKLLDRRHVVPPVGFTSSNKKSSRPEKFINADRIEIPLLWLHRFGIAPGNRHLQYVFAWR